MTTPPWGSLRIGATDWTVKPNEHSLVHGDLGTTVHRERLILLHPNGDGWQLREGALHEVIHAISISLWPGGDDDELTEKQVISLTTLLVSFVRDNPEFARWLVDGNVS